MNRLPLRIGIAILGFFGFSILAAQEANRPSIAVFASSSTIEVGSSGRVIFSIVGGKPDLELPAKFEAKGLSIRYVDDSYVDPAHYFNYRVSGNQPGQYKVPAVEVIVDGVVVKSEPITINIVTRSKPLSSASPRFGEIKIPNSRLYVNQLFSLEASLHVKGRKALHKLNSAELNHERFVIKPFIAADIDSNSFAGEAYSTAKVATTLFALKPGNHKLGPVDFNARVHVSNALKSYIDGVKVESEVVDIKINPLPEGGPVGFSGGVGAFELTQSASPLTLKVGDPLSIDFVVTGQGNLETLGAPVIVDLDASAWKQYKARKTVEISSDGILPGRAVFSQVLVPLKINSQLPSYQLSFFDPKLEKYVTRSTPNLSLNVLEDNSVIEEQENEGAVVGLATEAVAPLKEILPIAKTNSEFQSFGQKDLGKLALVVGNGVMAMLVLLVFFGCFTKRKREKSALGRNDGKLSFKEASRLVKPGLARKDFFHSAMIAFRIWEDEHQDAPAKVRDLVRDKCRKCESELYSQGDHSENSISTAEADEYIKVLRTIPVRKL